MSLHRSSFVEDEVVCVPVLRARARAGLARNPNGRTPFDPRFRELAACVRAQRERPSDAHDATRRPSELADSASDL